MSKDKLFITNNVSQKYYCPKCGVVTEYIEITIPPYQGKYCLKCYAKWINLIFPKLQIWKGE